MSQVIEAEKLGIGLHPDIPFSDYLQWPLMSQSVLKCGRREGGSMRQLKFMLDGEFKKKPTDDMILGSALHCCFLEPEEMPTKVAVYEGTRRGADWEQFRAENASKSILTDTGHAKLVGMVKSLRSLKEVREWQGKIQHVELSAIGDIDGVRFKARCDALTDDPIWDLKKTRGVDDRSIATTIWEFGYHIQGYIYTQLFGRSRFCLGMVEDAAPHEPRVVELSERWLELGRLESRDILKQHKECVAKKSWPFQYAGVDVIDPPGWVEEKFGSKQVITLGGIAI